MMSDHDSCAHLKLSQVTVKITSMMGEFSVAVGGAAPAS